MSTVPFIDFHCDTLMQAWFRHRKDLYQLPGTMLDVKRLRQGGARAQFFAIFLQSLKMKKYLGPLIPRDSRYIEKLMNSFYKTLQRHEDVIAFAGNQDDLKKNEKAGKISAFLTIEDGREVQGNMERLSWYREKGVRLLGLTWNYPNCFGYPNSRDVTVMKKGLTDFGKEAIGELNRLGILIDVSHLSDGGFQDVAKLSRKPFIASHSNARALCPHTRNLTDSMIRTLGEKGGVIGINHCPKFLYQNSNENRIEDLTAHILHIRNVGGHEVAALGSDFDGIHGKLAVAGPQEYEKLAQALRRAGLSEDEVDEIYYKNAERIIGDVLL
ncbi:MAG: dipeptidase [Lachnospiraceae bacterium]|nr:dipeptidase [Lachnospiraceae bacterium]